MQQEGRKGEIEIGGRASVTNWLRPGEWGSKDRVAAAMLHPPQPEEPGEEGVQDEGQEVEERGRVEVLLGVPERWTHTPHRCR